MNLFLLNFYDAIGTKTISDLTLPNHTLNQSKFEAALSHTWEDGYTYQIMDSGYPIQNNVINANYIPPSLFTRYVWDKIWEESGYEYYYRGKNNVFESNEFLSRTFTVDKSIKTIADDLTVETFVDKASFTFSNTISVGDTKLIAAKVDDEDSIHEVVQVSGVFSSQFSPDQDGFYRFDFILPQTYPDVDRTIYRNGKPISSIITMNNINSGVIVYGDSGDLFEIILTSTVDLSLTGVINVTYSESYSFVNFRNYLTNVKQRDFIKSVMQDFGLILQKEKDGRYSFITLNDLFYNNDNVVDWSKKFDRKVKLDTKLNSFGQENHLRYDYEDDAVFGDGSFLIPNETLPEDVEMFKSIMRASKPSERFAQVTLYGINFWNVDTDDLGVITSVNGNGETPYSFLTTRNAVNFNYSINGEVYSYGGVANVPVFKTISYNFIVNRFYNIYANVLERFEKYNVTMLLSAIDVYNMDFFKLYYIDELAANFYINKISGFKNGKVTNVELVKVDISKVKGEHNSDFNKDFTI